MPSARASGAGVLVSATATATATATEFPSPRWRDEIEDLIPHHGEGRFAPLIPVSNSQRDWGKASAPGFVSCHIVE